MKSKLKKKILKMLSENLSMFRPEHKDCFMCPTCMKVVSIKNLREISEAHIIPKAAGGKLKTFTCIDCNSKFGSKQDKWFGDIINIANSANPSLFSTGIKDGYFEIDGVKVNGTWKEEPNRGFSFFIHKDRNSPQQIELIEKKFGDRPPKINLSVPMPIMKNKRLIGVGFLTAAYLMWFGLLGYSWALQEHLDKIRKQIIEPEFDIIPPKFLATVEHVDWDPWIGLVTLFGDTVPAFGLKKHLVLLPPRDKPNYYDSIDTFKSDIDFSDIKPFQLPTLPHYGPPLSIVFENRLVVHAAPSKDSEKHSHVILYTNESDEGKILRPIGKEEFNELKKQKHAKYVKINVQDH